MSRALVLAFALLLALPAASAGLGPAAEEETPSAYAAVDGVSYYFAAGLVNGSALTHDAGAGERRLDFQGCAIAQFRPGFGRGRLALDGLIDGAVPIKLEMSDFDAPGDSVRANVTVDAANDAALPPGAKARAELAATGLAQMHAGMAPNDNNAPALANFTDPLTGEPELRAALFVTRDGVRDADGTLQPKAAADDEMHVVVSSPPGAQPTPDHASFGPPAATPDGSAFPDSEHAAVYTFLNTRYGGTAHLTVTSTSKAPPGANEIAVAVYAPDGFQVGNATVASSALGGGHATIDVPLDQMGEYLVLANGRLLLGNYRIDAELAPPPAFKLDFWWESVARGDVARSANSQCLKDLGLRTQVVSGSVTRHKPPGFPMELVVLAVAVAATTGLFIVRLGYETFSSAEFKRSFKK
jgi:hypothetical protein